VAGFHERSKDRGIVDLPAADELLGGVFPIHVGARAPVPHVHERESPLERPDGIRRRLAAPVQMDGRKGDAEAWSGNELDQLDHGLRRVDARGAICSAKARTGTSGPAEPITSVLPPSSTRTSSSASASSKVA